MPSPIYSLAFINIIESRVPSESTFYSVNKYSFLSILFCIPAPSGAPQNVREVEVTSTSITIQWDQVPCIEQNSEITGYIVRYSNSTGETQMAAVQNSQMFTASGLTPNTAYSFQVAAVNSDDEVGPYSSILEINTNLPIIGKSL